MIIVPIYILIILFFGVMKRVNCFDTFLEGSKEGIKNAFNLFPTIIGIVFAVNVFTGSGIIEILSRLIKKIFQDFHGDMKGTYVQASFIKSDFIINDTSNNKFDATDSIHVLEFEFFI